MEESFSGLVETLQGFPAAAPVEAMAKALKSRTLRGFVGEWYEGCSECDAAAAESSYESSSYQFLRGQMTHMMLHVRSVAEWQSYQTAEDAEAWVEQQLIPFHHLYETANMLDIPGLRLLGTGVERKRAAAEILDKCLTGDVASRIKMQVFGRL